MTSNMGSHIIQEKFENSNDIYSATEAARIEVLGLLRKTIRPEFLNRIDDIIMFTPLSKKDITKNRWSTIGTIKKATVHAKYHFGCYRRGHTVFIRKRIRPPIWSTPH